MKIPYKGILTFIVIVFIVAMGLVVYTYFTGYHHQTLGNNSVGYVTKDTYNYYESNDTIILITGIHPREKLAIQPEIEAVRDFALTHRINFINYNVTVTSDATDYSKSRANGESLVDDYVVPDINTTNAKVVIISHSHIPSYGEGFYVATPEMDNDSVSLAESIRDGGIDFNYYPVSDNMEYKSTSAVLVSKPVAQAGYPTLVYEIPENITDDESKNRTYELFEKCYELLF